MTNHFQRAEAEPDTGLAAWAATRHGVFSRRQALETGLTSRMIERRVGSGRWEVVGRGVYRYPGTPATWRQSLMVACLAAGPLAVASHRSAAALWAMDGFNPGPIELISAGGERQVVGAKLYRPRRLVRADTTVIDGIPVTTVARTIVDLASVVGGEELEAAIDWALRERRVTVAYLRRRLDAQGSRGRRGVGLLVGLLDDRAGHGAFESRPERNLEKMLVGVGLPRPVRQYRLLDARGDLLARFDLALPAARIAFEFESYRHHHGRRAWRRDVSRLNGVTAEGWLVFRLTSDDLVDPDRELLARVAVAYEARRAA